MGTHSREVAMTRVCNGTANMTHSESDLEIMNIVIMTIT